MNTKTVYQTNPQGLYVGPLEAEQSPLEPGVFLIPGGCVLVPPPRDVPDSKAACWTGEAWELLDYFNGLIVYNTANREPLTLTGVGTIPSGYTTKKPGPDQIWKAGRWVNDLNTQLTKLYVQKLAEINDGCAGTIVSGFTSNALGEPHHYDSALEDQVNLNSMILSGLDELCACTDALGEKNFRPHSLEHLTVVGQHLVLHKRQALQQALHLKARLAQAVDRKDLRAINAIVWTLPT